MWDWTRRYLWNGTSNSRKGHGERPANETAKGIKRKRQELESLQPLWDKDGNEGEAMKAELHDAAKGLARQKAAAGESFKHKLAGDSEAQCMFIKNVEAALQKAHHDADVAEESVRQATSAQIKAIELESAKQIATIREDKRRKVLEEISAMINVELAGKDQSVMEAEVLSATRSMTEVCKDIVVNASAEGAPRHNAEEQDAEMVEGITALHKASTQGHTEQVKTLVSSGAGEANKEGITTLHKASTQGHTEEVKTFVSGDEAVEATKEGKTTLHKASTQGHTEQVKTFVSGDEAVEATKAGKTPFATMTRVEAKMKKIACAFECMRKENETAHKTALYKAAWEGHVKIVELLTNNKADVNQPDSGGRTPLYWASFFWHTEVVNLLLRRGADPNKADKNGRTPLYWASNFGHTAIVKLLLKSGAEASKADEDGRTPLYWASMKGHTKIVKLLLGSGAEADKADKNGRTPLHWASCNGHTETVKLLLESGAKASKADKDDATPLHWASYYGHAEVVDLLLKREADVNKKDKGKETALLKASWRGHVKVVELLINNKADVNQPDSDGVTPLAIARAKGHKAVEALLLEHIAQ